MSNDLVSTTWGTVVLYSSMLVYLALGMTTTQYALRQSLDTIFVGEDASFTWRRHVSGAVQCLCVTRTGRFPCSTLGCCQGWPGGQAWPKQNVVDSVE